MSNRYTPPKGSYTITKEGWDAREEYNQRRLWISIGWATAIALVAGMWIGRFI